MEAEGSRSGLTTPVFDVDWSGESHPARQHLQHIGTYDKIAALLT